MKGKLCGSLSTAAPTSRSAASAMQRRVAAVSSRPCRYAAAAALRSWRIASTPLEANTSEASFSGKLFIIIRFKNNRFLLSAGPTHVVEVAAKKFKFDERLWLTNWLTAQQPGLLTGPLDHSITLPRAVALPAPEPTLPVEHTRVRQQPPALKKVDRRNQQMMPSGTSAPQQAKPKHP